MALIDLAQGLPGHPSHPPLTGLVVGSYTTGTIALVAGAVGYRESEMAIVGFWAIVAGIVASIAAAVTGLLDYMQISEHTPLKRTATSHMIAMVTTLLLMSGAVLALGNHHAVGSLGLTLSLAGLIMLAVGGWLGGVLVFVYGMRSERDLDREFSEAVNPVSSWSTRSHGHA